MNISTLFGLASIGFYPNILRSTIDPAYTINLHNTAVSQTSLIILLTVACLGLPLVFAYGAWLYKSFSGKTSLHKTSY
jgi:cytochrome d ubiquinol oxidase subunit II